MKTKHLKCFLLLMVLALLLVSLPACAASKTFTQEQTDAWVARCIADYDALHQKDAMHFSRTRTMTRQGEDKVTLTDAQIWFRGDDYLKENVDYKGVRLHAVTKNATGYKMQAADGQSEVWTPAQDPAYEFTRYHTLWEDRGYQFESIRGKGDETEVTFYWNLGHDNCTLSAQTYRLTFCYQGENISRIFLVFTTYNGTRINPEEIRSVETNEYVFHSTPESEITAKIDAAYQKATGK